MNKTQKVFKFGKELLNTVKAVKSGIDDSFVFVQGGLASLANPKAGARAFLEQWKDFASEKRFNRQIKELHDNKPLWNLIEETGLDILDPNQVMDKKREEQIGGSNLLEKKIPIGKDGFRLSKITTAPFERLYTSMGNNLRLNIFLDRVAEMNREGKTIENDPQEFKDMARVVNEMTGRGKMHAKLEPASDAISWVLWSPKLLASSLNILGVGDVANLAMGGKKGYYSSLTPSQRRFALTQTVRGIGTGVAIMAALSLNKDWDVDYNPTSVSFGTVQNTKTGDSYNVFGRFTSIVRLIAMLTTGKKTIKGESQDASTGREAWKFIRGKFNPVAGVATDGLITHKTFNGKPYKLDDLYSDLGVPMFIADINKGLQQQGTISLLTRGIPTFLGIKASNVADFSRIDKTVDDLIERNTEYNSIERKNIKNYNDKGRPISDNEFNKFVSERKKYIEKRLKLLWDGKDKMSYWLDKDGTVVPKKFAELTEDEIVEATSQIKSDATKSVKKSLFGEQEESIQDEIRDGKLELARERAEINNENN